MKLGAFRMLDNDDEVEPSDGIKAGTLFASKDKPATPVPLTGKGRLSWLHMGCSAPR